MSAGGRYLAITTVRTRFTLPALQLHRRAARGAGPARAVRGRPSRSHAGPCDALLLRAATSTPTCLNGVTLSADGERVAFASFAGNLFFGDANQTRRRLRRRAPARAGAPTAARGSRGRWAGRDDRGRRRRPADRRAGEGRGRAGRIVLTVSVPAAGGVKAVAKARAGEPRKLRTLATATARARGVARSSVRLLLRPVGRYRAELRERERSGARGRRHLRRLAWRPPRERIAASRIPAGRWRARSQHSRGQGVNQLVTSWQRFGNAVENDL